MLTWLGALVVGLSLGLLGSGGSILTVPILVYVVGMSPKLAVAASLAIVGSIALIGAASHARQRLVDWRYVVTFGVPGIVATYAGAWVSHFVSGAVQLVVFAVVMGLASWTMLRPAPAARETPQRHFVWLLAAGAAVGLITGFVGVGGGFMFVPALVMLGGLSMHRAVGTSLAVIALNSASGFVGHHVQLTAGNAVIPWREIAVFALIGALGSLAGQSLGSRLAHASLRRAFGVLLIAMSGFVLWRTLPEILVTRSGDRGVEVHVAQAVTAVPALVPATAPEPAAAPTPPTEVSRPAPPADWPDDIEARIYKFFADLPDETVKVEGVSCRRDECRVTMTAEDTPAGRQRLAEARSSLLRSPAIGAGSIQYGAIDDALTPGVARQEAVLSGRSVKFSN